MNKLLRRNILQTVFLITLILCISIALHNLNVNLTRTNVGINIQWLLRPSGFAVAESLLPFNSSDSYLWALIIGWMNSLKVIIFGLILSTLIGSIAGIARISKNKLLKLVASSYVALIRQTPLLLQLLFWYFVVFLRLPEEPLPLINSAIVLSNKSINVLGINLTVEFTALLFGLSIFTGASISEVIRGGINSVKKGQIEAYRSLGLSENIGVRIIVMPQALPAILPGLTNQYLNLAKNSTLAIAVGYPDIYAISDTTITQTGRSIEGFLIILISFLFLNLIINKLMNIINKTALTLNRNNLNKNV